MATALTQFARYVRMDVDGCPEPVLLDAVLRAGIEFCSRVVSIREEIDIDLVIGQSAYPLVVDGSYVSVIAEVAKEDNSILSPRNAAEFDSERYDKIDGEPMYYYMDNAQNLIVGYRPQAVETLTVTTRIIPKEDATTLPDVLAQQYKLDIAAGAKAILMMQKNKPWSDLQLAAVHQGQFERAVVKENVRFFRGNSRKQSEVRPQFF